MDLFSLLFLLGFLGLGYTPLNFSFLSLAPLLTDTHNTSPLSSITLLWWNGSSGVRSEQAELPCSICSETHSKDNTQKEPQKMGVNYWFSMKSSINLLGNKRRDSGMGGHGFMNLNDEMHLLNEKDHTFVREPGRRLVLVLHKSVTGTSIRGVWGDWFTGTWHQSHVKGLFLWTAPLLLIPPKKQKHVV